MDANLYEDFHKRVEELTGDPWCPYPSGLMMKVVMEVDDKTAKRLIIERRGFSFGWFLGGDPMQEELAKLLANKND